MSRATDVDCSSTVFERTKVPDAKEDDECKVEGAMRTNKLQRWKENKARGECADNTARKTFARLRYIKYNYSDSEKREHRLKLMIIRYTMVCARSNRRGTYVDAMQCICNVKHSCARRVLLTSQGTLTYISWMLQQYSAFSSLPSCSLSFYRVF